MLKREGRSWNADAGMRISLCLLAVICVSGCGQATPQVTVSEPPPVVQSSMDAQMGSDAVTFADARDRTVTMPGHPVRVVSAYGSFAEAWTLAGGPLVGVTEDVRTDGRITLSKDMGIIGSVKEPSAELLIGLQPELVLLSADIESHVKLGDLLQQANVPHAFFHVETFPDYLKMLKTMTLLTDRPDLLQTNGLDVERRIHALLASRSPEAVKVLLIRAHAKGAKALGEDTATGIMLKELGAVNIAQSDAPLLKELSLEAIIQSDPDLILITTMGSEEQAVAYLQEGLMKNPAWAGLKAAKTENIHVLPKDLFQYKPNNRWDKAYAHLAELMDACR